VPPVNTQSKDQLPQAPANLVLKSLAVVLVLLAQQHALHARPTITCKMVPVLLVTLANIHLLDQLPHLLAKFVLMSPDVTLVLLAHQHAQHARPIITWLPVPVLPVPPTHSPTLDQLPQVTAKLALILSPDVLLVLLAHQHVQLVLKIIT